MPRLVAIFVIFNSLVGIMHGANFYSSGFGAPVMTLAAVFFFFSGLGIVGAVTAFFKWSYARIIMSASLVFLLLLVGIGIPASVRADPGYLTTAIFILLYLVGLLVLLFKDEVARFIWKS